MSDQHPRQADRAADDPRREYDQGGPPNARPRERGSRQDNPEADEVLPGRAFGAGGQTSDGPAERNERAGLESPARPS